MMATERVRIHLEAKSVPALGYTTYAFEQGGDFLRGGLVSGLNTLENEHLRVQIRADGTLDVLHKETKRQFTGLHYFEDGGEAGHAWMHIEPAADRILTSHGFPVGIALEENGPLLARFRVEYQMRIPCGLEENGSDPWQRLDGVGSASSRSNEARALTIVSWITLRKGARCVEVTTRFENRSDNHRLRVLFPTRLPAKTCFTESAFDVVERPVVHRPDSPWYGGVNATFPMQRFIDVNDGKAGLAVIVDGLREYQVSPDPDRAIALTLLRAFEVSLTTVSKRWEAHPEMRLSQSPGEHEFRYWICPHASGWERGDVLAEVERFSVPLEPAQAGAHGGDLPQELSFMGVEPGNLVVTAIKRAEDGSGLVVRFFNPTRKAISGKIKTCRPIRSAHLLNLEERVVEKLSPQGKMLSLKSGAKKILTVKLVL
jgi:alpha-mannosidase